MFRILLVASLALLSTHHVKGHGYLLDPPNRSSLWRDPAFHDLTLPINYQDNQNFCGGFVVQWEQHQGQCGVCGDSIADPQPRANELGGFYYKGVISRKYHEGSNIQLRVELTAAHLGQFVFSVCNLDGGRSETEECFQEYPLRLITGEDTYKGDLGRTGTHFVYVTLPEGLLCQHCVLRWHYSGGNNWGMCENGSQALGCGAQETFRTCSDISIIPKH